MRAPKQAKRWKASHSWRVRVWRFRRAAAKTVRDFDRNDYLTQAAALAFYFFLALFPLLIFLAAALAYVPVPHLFDRIQHLLAVVAPPDVMSVVQRIFADILQRHAELLSASIAVAIVAASSGFDAMITALNLAYDVPERRPFLKRRVVAVGLTLLTGAGTVAVLAATVLGPRFGEWLVIAAQSGWVFAAFWPWLRWVAITLLTVLSVEVIYFVAPNVKQKVGRQIPGAALAVASWVGASWGLSWYLRSFAEYNRTFGTLGAVVALMLWLYLSALAILLGAELNAELAKAWREWPERVREGREAATAEESSGSDPTGK
jgi:membrane protein